MADESKNRKIFKTRLKVKDEVIVISGKSRKARGKILALNTRSGRVLIQGVNLKKRFTRPSQENPKGGIIEAEAPLHLSNIMFYDAKAKKGSRIKMGVNKSGQKVRILVASGREID